MDELVRWLGQQLDEDERIARAACWDEQSDVWTARPPQGTYAQYEQYTVVDYCGDGVVIVRPENADDDGVGQHVAAWDPARVLREIDAKRQLVKLHSSAVLRAGGGAQYFNTQTVCRSCEPSYQFPEQSWPCSTLRVLALPYAGRPGYREEWRP